MVNRRSVLARFVQVTLTAVASVLATVTGGAVLAPPRSTKEEWVRAGTVKTLKPDQPTALTVWINRQDGWQALRQRTVVYVMRTEETSLRALSPVCTHLGCHVRWNSAKGQFHCPCHGGVYSSDGAVLDGPPPRPLSTIESRLDGDSILVKL